MCPSFTGTLQRLSSLPSSVSDEELAEIEQFVVILYCRTDPEGNVNAARKYLFAKGNKTLDHIPPTQAALLEHVKRAVYQGSYVWNQCLEACPAYPSPGEWGWERDSSGTRWLPRWTSLPEASKACKEFIACGCDPAKGCKKLYKCHKACLQCTDLCKCRGGGECA